MPPTIATRITGLLPRSQTVKQMLPGLLVATVIGIAAQFLSEHYGAPAMLMALLLGIAFHFLSEEGRCVEGIGFTSRAVLRFGVALLGARVSVELLIHLGPGLIALTVAGVILTILFGLRHVSWDAARISAC